MATQPGETPTAEEIKQEEAEEEELIATPEEAKIREKLIEDLGLDADADADLLDRLAKKELEDRKRFGKVVGQKRKWRGLATTKPEKEIEKVQPDEDKPLTAKELEAKLTERDFKRELNDLDVSDELRKQVETYAKLNNCSPKEALKSKYISFLKEEDDKKAEEVEAAATGTRRTRTGKGEKLTIENFAEYFDYNKLSTKEGREEYDAFKKENKME